MKLNDWMPDKKAVSKCSLSCILFPAQGPQQENYVFSKFRKVYTEDNPSRWSPMIVVRRRKHLTDRQDFSQE